MLKALLSAALLGALAAAPAQAAPDSLLYERAFMLEADRRCVLFSPEVRSALRVAAAQARRTALRAHRTPELVEMRAQGRARTVSCASADLKLAASRVRSAHQGWLKVQRMDFPGDRAAWLSDRTPSKSIRWRLVQTGPAAAFGLAGAGRADVRPYAVARFPRNARPALVRLTVGRRTFIAETNEPAPETLASDPAKGLLTPPAWAFRFPAGATAALDQAASGDAIRLHFVSSAAGRDRGRSVEIERGDYAAARAFSRP